MLRNFFLLSSVAFVAPLLSGCIPNNNTPPSTGGSAGGSVSIDAPEQVSRCNQTAGTVAIDSGEGKPWHSRFREESRLDSIVPLLEHTILQSNCFTITTQGSIAVQQKITNTSSSMRGSDFRPSDKNQNNTRIGSDYYLEPTVNYSDNKNIRIPGIPILGSLDVGSTSTQVTLRLYDTRSQVLIASSVGNANGENNSSNNGKIISQALINAYNQMVPAIIAYKPQKIIGGAGNGGNLKAPK